MIKKVEELSLNVINKLPFKVKQNYNNGYYYSLVDSNLCNYYLFKRNKDDYLLEYDIRRTGLILIPIFEVYDNNYYYQFYKENINKNEGIPVKKILEIYKNFFNQTKAFVHIDKEKALNLNNLFKVLDSKLSYLEIRIREIEVKPFKDDLDWIVLAKYHVILDARVYIYDLQSDILKLIEKGFDEELGYIFKFLDRNIIVSSKILPNSKIYLGTVANLYSRTYISIDNINDLTPFKNELDKESKFIKKYFLLLVLYIYIIDFNSADFQIGFNVLLYVELTRRIEKVIKLFGEYSK